MRDLEREKRRLEEGMVLEKSSAQLERSTCDKYRVRVAELEQKVASLSLHVLPACLPLPVWPCFA